MTFSKIERFQPLVVKGYIKTGLSPFQIPQSLVLKKSSQNNE